MIAVAEDEPRRDRTTSEIPTAARAGLVIVGASSWAAGGVAVFINANGVGAAALLAAGILCIVLSMLGRWPSRISVSGSEVSWDDVKDVLDNQITVAKSEGEGNQAIEELLLLRSRIRELEATGTAPDHPAEAYDRAVGAALGRLMPEASIQRESIRSGYRADFVVDINKRRLFVETKWRSNPGQPFRGSTLEPLVQRLTDDVALLVIVNADDEGLIEQGSARLTQLRPHRSRVVAWRDVRDDERLGEALAAVLT